MHDPDQIQAVMRYHERSKHQFNRYARGPTQLDWANQPNPFRRYAGAHLVQLPILGAEETPLSPRYAHLYRRAAVPNEPLTLRSLSRLFEYALAISAWKQAGATRWALRCNPSSGNLHPTEAYLLIGPLAGLADTPGVYHYAVREHGLERRLDFPAELFAQLTRGLAAQAFLIGLSSLHWREAWKYGERAFRYCQHDVGHAIGSLRIAAAALGWRAWLLQGLADETIEDLLGLKRDEDFALAEREHPDLVLAVLPTDRDEDGRCMRLLAPDVDRCAARELARQRWTGRANRLSQDDPVPWAAIDEVELASRKPASKPPRFEVTDASVGEPEVGAGAEAATARQIILQRRSLLACDGRTSISAGRFFQMLARVMPRVELPALQRPIPWDALPWDPALHLGLFVHRVAGLDPGLYMLVRDPAKAETLKRAMHAHFAWSVPPGCPAELPLHLLEVGDARRLATQVSCFQDIAGDGAFSLGMIAQYQETLFTHGPWSYRRLFWEAGLIGQVLYLEAEAAGVRATGIGCFFDDPVHQIFGLEGLAFQSLYHFTVGGAVDDARLTQLEPYGPRVAVQEEGGIDLP
ncbi:MAG: SagB/ThcOx family dehydrogenase [Burkholderiaceae bacterium]